MKKLILAILFCWPLLAAAQAQTPKVIAYYTGSADSIKKYPLEKLTHIIYSFLRLKNDTLTFWSDQQRNNLMQLVALKKTYPKLKIMVSIGGWSGCEPCSALFTSAEHRNTFAQTTVDLFKEFQIDGLDLDWEYPAIEGYPGHPYAPSDRQNFTELVKALRVKMGNYYSLTFAAGGFDKFLENSIDWDAVMPQVDFVNLMTYDLVSGYATVTGHHTLLNDYMPGQQSTSRCVNWLLRHHAKPEQLIIGAAFYARVWENVGATNNGLYQPGKFKEGVDYHQFDSYFSNTASFAYHWDKKAQAPFQYSPARQLFATFDDERSIKAKAKFVRQKKLGGIMFWELKNDKKTGGLVDAICRNLK